MDLNSSEYNVLFNRIKERIRLSQYAAMQSVNTELINLYWAIGSYIVEKQDEFGWGKSVVQQLAKDLQIEFPGTKGYSSNNLWYMRQFYIEHNNSTILQPLVGEVSWSKHIIIMSKCHNDRQKEFYVKMTKTHGWTKNILIHQIEGNCYERSLQNQTNFDTALDVKYQEQAVLAVKDHYLFDFLEMSTDYSEHELEISLIKNIRKFMLEMGGEFAFIGNQYPLIVGGDEFSIDLLLFHRKLRALVAIELKVKKFKPADVGQLQFYLTVLDEQIKQEHEEPSIGIIICKEKNRTVVEYALRTTNNPIGVAIYSMSSELPDSMKGCLPSAHELIAKIDLFSADKSDSIL